MQIPYFYCCFGINLDGGESFSQINYKMLDFAVKIVYNDYVSQKNISSGNT